MSDLDPLVAAFIGSAVTPERIDSASRQLVMLRSLLEEVTRTVPSLAPPGSAGWRSTAADRYVDGLDDLRMRLFGARDLLSEAARVLDDRIRSMREQLEAQTAASAGRAASAGPAASAGR